MRRLLPLLVLLLATAAHAEYRPIKIVLDDDGDQYLRIITWHQLWLRYTEFNPGTAIDPSGEQRDSALDIGMRRSRVLLYGQLTPRLHITTHFGFDNQTFNSGKKPQLFMHDAFVDYDVVPGALTLGGGLHYYNGVSRMTMASTMSFLAVDAPIFNWPTIERSDQFARMYGIYAKGRLGALDYKLAVNQPFATGGEATETGDYNNQRTGLSYAAYLSYAFADLEANALPYTTGTYLGKKRVINIGLGGYLEPEGIHFIEDGERETQALAVLGADIFADLPLGDAGALTAYGVFYRYDFGPDNIRNVGIMNIGSAATTGPDGDGAPDPLSVNGPGNAYPMLGTGNQIYALLGYLLPTELGDTRFQPYAALTAGLFDALADPALTFEGGLNILLYGHQAKLTVHVRNRPVYALDDAGDALVDSRANEVILQTQMAF